mgnify:CR=1 FL=1
MSGKEIHTKETFQVLGMSCAVCALNVETTLGAQEGVYEAKVNFAGSTVLVDYNPRVITPVELQKAVESAGYELVVENFKSRETAREKVRFDEMFRTFSEINVAMQRVEDTSRFLFQKLVKIFLKVPD